ncbi:MAG: diguanylate cyclase [Acidobacteria bacterium]|nr:diguanylate cyclase [Acidobacteriota bacterium]
MPTILIVDDAISSRKEIKRILEDAGVFTRFFEAENGAAGLQVLKEVGEGIDVVLCDRIMPRMDGHKFLESVRQDALLSHLPVVILSEETKLKDIVKAFELGAYDFISKPILPPILCARLKAILHTKQLQDQLKLQKQLMEKLATTDPLAQVPNVRFFQRRLEDEVRRTFRYKSPLNLVMIDIDHFKQINDTYGHPRGDTVIKELAANLQEAMRSVDLVARYGGEEFVVLLPQTDRQGAALVAERVRERAEKHRFPGLPEDVHVTISVGVAHYDGQNEMRGQDLVDEADQALYEAKKKGRNQVVLAWENKPLNSSQRQCEEKGSA